MERLAWLIFFIEHFTENDHTDPHPEHQESPFSDQHDCTNHLLTIVSLLPEKLVFKLQSPVILIEKASPIFSISNYFSPYKPNIWQPPKL
jgi:hypothetical protein